MPSQRSAPPPPSDPVGIIGLGKLGHEIAVRLLEAGYSVIGYKRSGTSDLVAAGGVGADSPAQIARQCRHIILCLPSEEALGDVVGSDTGLLHALGPGSIVIDTSTLSEEAKTRARSLIETQGSAMLDCTISGKPAAMRAGKSAMFVSGEATTIDKVSDILAAITPHCVQLGAFGAATRMKLVTNMLMTMNCFGAVETLNFAASMGFDPETVAQALANSGAASAQLAIRAPIVTNGAPPNPGAIAGIMKDLALIEQKISDAGLAAPTFREMRKTFVTAEAENPPAGDISLLYLSGLKALERD